MLVGHRQAVAWIDDWYGMTIEDVRDYEKKMQKETNERLLQEMESQDTTDATYQWFSDFSAHFFMSFHSDNSVLLQLCIYF